LHNSNFPNGHYFGRVSGRSGAEIAQDETATFATMIFFGCHFSWPSFSKMWRHNLFSAVILAEQATVIVSK